MIGDVRNPTLGFRDVPHGWQPSRLDNGII